MPFSTHCLVSRRTRPCRRASCGSAGPGSIRPGWPPRGRTRCTGTCRRVRLHVSTSRNRKPHDLECLNGVCVLQCAALVPAAARPHVSIACHRQLIIQDAQMAVLFWQCAPLVPAGACAPLSTFRSTGNSSSRMPIQDAHSGCPYGRCLLAMRRTGTCHMQLWGCAPHALAQVRREQAPLVARAVRCRGRQEDAPLLLSPLPLRLPSAGMQVSSCIATGAQLLCRRSRAYHAGGTLFGPKGEQQKSWQSLQ